MAPERRRDGGCQRRPGVRCSARARARRRPRPLRSRLRPRRRVVAALVADSFPAQPPALSAPKPLVVPPVVERQLANGLRLLIVEQHELPLVDAVLAIRSGVRGGSRRAAGAGHAHRRHARRGHARPRRARHRRPGCLPRHRSLHRQRLGRLERRRCMRRPRSWTARSRSSPTSRSARRFPSDELERQKQNRLTSLVQLRDRGPAIADRVFPEVLYGDDHAYGRPTTGTQATTRAITRADVQRFYDRYYRPNNATLIVVGDVTPDDVERRLQRLFGGWQAMTRAGAATGQLHRPPPRRKSTWWTNRARRSLRCASGPWALRAPRRTTSRWSS